MAELDYSKVNYETYSDEKRQKIQQSVLDARKDLQDTQLTIEAMRKRQRMLFHDLKHYTAALAPHKQLPNDVLREIFIWCACAGGRTDIHQIRKLAPQLVLSHVCSPWRQVALSTGELWSNVSVWLTSSSKVKTLDIAEIWLKRAGNFPVYLHLDVSSKYEVDCTTVFKKLCSNAQIACFDSDLLINKLNELSALPDDLLQRVKEVRLTTNLFSAAKPPRLPSFIRHTRFLSCESPVSTSLNVSEFPLPWDQIRYLDLGDLDMSMSQYFGFLRHMVSLEECRLPPIELQGDNLAADQQNVFTLPQLKTLILCLVSNEGDSAAGALNKFIHTVTTPRLRKLALQGDVILDAEAATILAAQLNIHQLEELELHELWSSDILVNTLLRNAPSLRRITFLPNQELNQETISQLATGRLGSCLESVEFPRCRNAKEIINMVKSRQQNAKTVKKSHGSARNACTSESRVSPFKEVWLSSSESHKKWAKRIATLNGMGVEIVMNHYRFSMTSPRVGGIGAIAGPIYYSSFEDVSDDKWSELARPSHIFR
ncbi:hypothetical protein AX17_004758 [Amanita inopinata Kibby_2008]|nr:hypothetical protein AX17_004758 [Amanita inopinata Kibby_2008]